MERFVDFFSDHFLIGLVWVFLFIAVIYVSFLCWFAKFSEISRYEVIKLINQKQSMVIDIRDQDHFYQGHIINSVHLSAADIRSGGAHEYLHKFGTRLLIIVCSDGVLSCSIARYLYQIGFRQIYVLKGGISGWRAESLPLVMKKKVK